MFNPEPDQLYIQDVTLRDGMHAIRHQYGIDHVSAHRPGAGRSRRRRHRGRPWRRPATARPSTMASAPIPTGNGSRRSARWSRRPGSPPCCCPASARSRICTARIDLGVHLGAHRHPLHRGRHRQTAYRLRPQARHGRVRLPDDEPHERRPSRWPQQAKLMEDYGAHCVYVTDSGGALDMDGYARAAGGL